MPRPAVPQLYRLTVGVVLGVIVVGTPAARFLMPNREHQKAHVSQTSSSPKAARHTAGRRNLGALHDGRPSGPPTTVAAPARIPRFQELLSVTIPRGQAWGAQAASGLLKRDRWKALGGHGRNGAG